MTSFQLRIATRMGTTLSLIFRRLAAKFSNFVQKKNPPASVQNSVQNSVQISVHSPVHESSPESRVQLLHRPFLDLVSGLSANWQTAHARVGGVQPLNLEVNFEKDGSIWSIQLGTVTVEAVRHMPDTVEALTS